MKTRIIGLSSADLPAPEPRPFHERSETIEDRRERAQFKRDIMGEPSTPDPEPVPKKHPFYDAT